MITTRNAATLALLALAACARPGAPSPAAGTSPEISERDLRHRLFLIAHDSLMGRETGSEGAFKAADYIASEFRRLGLARVSRMVHDAALAIANADERPRLDAPRPTDPNTPCRQ